MAGQHGVYSDQSSDVEHLARPGKHRAHSLCFAASLALNLAPLNYNNLRRMVVHNGIVVLTK
jgi:hypothetical protein